MRKRKKYTEKAISFVFSIESFADAHEIGRNTVLNEIESGRLKARKVNNRSITIEDAADWRWSLALRTT